MIAIAAMSLNRVIGKDGKLPWPSIKEDFAFFKKMTKGNSIVVGRKTFEKLPKLKDRNIFVYSRTPICGCWVSESGNLGRIVFCHQQLPPDCIVCGGAEIYSLLLPKCDTLYLTTIKQTYEGDTFMPEFDHLFNHTTIIENGENYFIQSFTR